MYCPARSSKRAGQAGFTLIELMIGVVIGLLASLAVTHVLIASEGNKRTTTSGSDAQVSGALALGTLQRSVQAAGYGFGAIPAVVGCTLTATFNGAAIAGFPDKLVPVQITPNATANMPDTIRILASGKSTFSMPVRVIANYKKNDQLFQAASGLGVAPPLTIAGVLKAPGDLMVVAVSTSTPCAMFQVTSQAANPLDIKREDDAAWNAAGTPADNYSPGSFLVNMGKPMDVTYSIVNDSLRASTLRIDTATSQPSYDAAPVELFPGIVNLQAYYGKDTNGDGKLDAWNKTAPTTNAEWLQVTAVRIAVVARSTQYEKENVTNENLLWDVGSSIAMAGTEDCTFGAIASKCLRLKVDHLADWKHYRYRVFDTVVPLRNMLWNS
jgi:type IV pilus assembly protein PilW